MHVLPQEHQWKTRNYKQMASSVQFENQLASSLCPILSRSRNTVGFITVHYCDVIYIYIMNTIASQITSLTIVYLTVNSGTDQRKHQSSASLAFVRGIHRRPVNSPHKGPVTRKMFPFDDVIMDFHLQVFRQHYQTNRCDLYTLFTASKTPGMQIISFADVVLTT